MTRRSLIAAPFAAAARAAYVPKRKYRVALIGHTGHGNFGHDWDIAWQGIPNVEVAAVADPDLAGRAKAKERSGAAKSYAAYREMLAMERPDIVTICPRSLEERAAMLGAAAEVRAHVLMEKPFAASVEEARRMQAAARQAGIKVHLGHVARVMGVTRAAREALERGDIGQLMEIRARGKEDRRAGGEDMMVLGTHCFDLMRYFGGDPAWVFAHITDAGRELTRPMMRAATEPIGLIGGNDVAAMFYFKSGVHGYFGSKTNDMPRGARFGVTLYGSKGLIYLPQTSIPVDEPYWLSGDAWVSKPGETNWKRIAYPPGTAFANRQLVNQAAALDLLEAVETGREPACSATDGLWTIEMVHGVYQSQFAGGKVVFQPPA